MIGDNVMGEYSGVVKWYNVEKGFGFIIEQDTQKEYFVHFTDVPGVLKNPLLEGMIVSFDVVYDDRNGYVAKNVTFDGSYIQ